LHAPWQHRAPSRDRSHVRPIQTAVAQAVHWKGGVGQGLSRMLPALHAAMRCLALSACLVFFVRCVCVIKLSVLPPAPRQRLQRCRDAGNARPGAAAAFSRLHESEFPAPARVSLACLCMRADFVSLLTGWSTHKVLCVCVLGPWFLCVLDYICNRVTCQSGQTSAISSLRGHVVGFCMLARAHTGLQAHVTFSMVKDWKNATTQTVLAHHRRVLLVGPDTH